MSLLKGVKNKIWQDCTATVAADKKRHIIVNFKVQFTKMKRSEFLDFINSKPEGEELMQYMHDWKLDGNNGELVPFVEENIDDALSDVDYSRAIFDGFKELHFGKETWARIKAKN